MKESARDLHDRSRWTKEDNVCRSQEDWLDKEQLERENEVDGENIYSPERKKKLRAERPGEKPPERTRISTKALLSKAVSKLFMSSCKQEWLQSNS
jgi:hypothetical protein